MLGLSRSTTYRYVSTLVTLGYLEQDVPPRYRLGLGVIDLGMATLSAMGLCNHARPYMQELAQRSGATVELAVLDGSEVLLIEQVRGMRSGRGGPPEDVGAGSRLPTHCTSLGKVLLAHLPAERRLELISEMDLVEQGPKTITSARALAEQLEDVRSGGLAVSDEERVAGTCAIAAPVRDESSAVVAAVNVAAHDDEIELEELVNRFAGPLELTAQRISTRLGWPDAQS
jgi:IclR family transcriptional regulator, pca regulon regulatory protein